MDADPRERYEHWCRLLARGIPARYALYLAFAIERRDHYARILGLDTIGDLV